MVLMRIWLRTASVTLFTHDEQALRQKSRCLTAADLAEHLTKLLLVLLSLNMGTE